MTRINELKTKNRPNKSNNRIEGILSEYFSNKRLSGVVKTQNDLLKTFLQRNVFEQDGFQEQYIMTNVQLCNDQLELMVALYEGLIAEDVDVLK